MRPILTICAAVAAASATSTSGGFNEYVTSCKNKALKGDCRTISLINKLDTCMEIPEASSAKYGDKGSSFQVNGQMACRVFKTDVTHGCKDPSTDSTTGLTGTDGQRASGWLVYPGITDWTGGFAFQSFMCTSTVGRAVGQLPSVVVAMCKDDPDVDYACRGDTAVPPGGG